MFNYRAVHLEVSSKCTLKCPRCPRTELDRENINQEFSLADFQSGFPVDVVSKIEFFLFCGDIGDPIYATEFLEIIDYIKQNSKGRIRIVTNGSYKKAQWWQRLGSMLGPLDQVTFSVDGWDNQSNNQYRVNSDFDSIVSGIKTLRSSSDCLIQWSTIYFSFNQDRMDDIRRLAESLGCDRFQTVKSSKFDGRYAANNVDLLKPKGQYTSNSSVYEVDIQPLTENKYIPITPATPVHPHAWAKCLNYKKELFVGVDGLVLPCPWFNSGYQHNAFVRQHRDRLSIKHRSFFEILNDTVLWNQLVESFEHNPLEICKIKCRDAQQ